MFFIVVILIFTLYILLFAIISPLSKVNIQSGVILEFFWTLLPLLIVFTLLIPLIYDYTFKEVCSDILYLEANQWYWSSEGVLGKVCASLVSALYGSALLLEVLHGSSYLVNLTSNDVLHSFGLNSLYLKIDCVPGVLHGITMSILNPGVYIAQCTELCGVNHSLMPVYLFVI